jgi:hypothetical protein
MGLVHKSINIREEVWRQLRINAELTGVPVRDFLTYLIVTSQPVQEDDAKAREQLAAVARANEAARQDMNSPAALIAPELQAVLS